MGNIYSAAPRASTVNVMVREPEKLGNSLFVKFKDDYLR